MHATSTEVVRVALFGREVETLRPMVAAQARLALVDDAPDVVVCFGGDGTLLAAEQKWPGVPKVPIRNSRRGIRCIPDPPAEVIERLGAGLLIRNEHLKLRGEISAAKSGPPFELLAINEFSVGMGKANSSVRFRLWFGEKPYGDKDHEIIGDGFIICSPFGSTAYFNQITRGVFWQGIGVAFKYTGEHTNHLIVPEDTVVRVEITRGPAILAHDNAEEAIELNANDRITVRKHDEPAILLTTDA